MVKRTVLTVLLVLALTAVSSAVSAQESPSTPAPFSQLISNVVCEGIAAPMDELIHIADDPDGRPYQLSVTIDELKGKPVALLGAMFLQPSSEDPSPSYQLSLVHSSFIGEDGTILRSSPEEELVVRVFPCGDEFRYEIVSPEVNPPADQCAGTSVKSGDDVLIGFESWKGMPMYLHAGGGIREDGHGEYSVQLWTFVEKVAGSGKFFKIAPAMSVVHPEGTDIGPWRGVGAHLTVCNRELRYSVIYENG